MVRVFATFYTTNVVLSYFCVVLKVLNLTVFLNKKATVYEVSLLKESES